MSRQQQIRRTILEHLEHAEPYALPEKTLRDGITLVIRPPVARAEFDDAMNYLGPRGYIRPMEDELDPSVTKWLITEAGKTLLRK